MIKYLDPNGSRLQFIGKDIEPIKPQIYTSDSQKEIDRTIDALIKRIDKFLSKA